MDLKSTFPTKNCWHYNQAELLFFLLRFSLGFIKEETLYSIGLLTENRKQPPEYGSLVLKLNKGKQTHRGMNGAGDKGVKDLVKIISLIPLKKVSGSTYLW